MDEPDGPRLDLRRLVEVLDRHSVEYLICGGAAAEAYGVRRKTEDADCVVRRERQNLDRLASALRELNARLRVARMSDQEAKELPFQIDGDALDESHLSTFMTDAGPFDVLDGLEAVDGQIVPYEELVQRSQILKVGGFPIHAAALNDIIIAKERANRPKDREALPELRAIRDAATGRERVADEIPVVELGTDLDGAGVSRPGTPSRERDDGHGIEL